MGNAREYAIVVCTECIVRDDCILAGRILFELKILECDSFRPDFLGAMRDFLL